MLAGSFDRAFFKPPFQPLTGNLLPNFPHPRLTIAAYGNSCASRRQPGELSKIQRPHLAGGHGLYSKELVLPNEDTAELDRPRASLRAEHQPINTTEDMLAQGVFALAH